MRLFCLFIAEKNYDDGIQAALVAHQFRVCTPSLGFDSVVCFVVHPELYSRIKRQNSSISDILRGKKKLADAFEKYSKLHLYHDEGRKRRMNLVPPSWTGRGKPEEICGRVGAEGVCCTS